MINWVYLVPILLVNKNTVSGINIKKYPAESINKKARWNRY
jgi:hypothetical protein